MRVQSTLIIGEELEPSWDDVMRLRFTRSADGGRRSEHCNDTIDRFDTVWLFPFGQSLEQLIFTLPFKTPLLQRSRLKYEKSVRLRPSAARGLRERRGGKLRADCVENVGGSPLDIFEALAEELRVTAVQADIVLSG